MKPTNWTKTAAAASLAMTAALQPLYADTGSLDGLKAAASQLSGDPSAALNGLFDDDSRVPASFATPTMLPSGQPRTEQELKQSMVKYLDVIQESFASQYGPGLYKEQNEGWNLDGAIAKAKKQVESSDPITIAQYHDILREFFNSMKDYHVSVRFDSTETSSLPFSVAGANGHYFIEWIDRDKLPQSAFPFNVGDELVQLGGKKTADVVAGLKAKLGGNTALTDQALAAMILTSRRGASFGDVQQGPVSVTVLPKGSSAPQTRPVRWDYTPELISEPKIQRNLALLAAGSQAPGLPMPEMLNMLSPVQQEVAGANAGNPFGLGNHSSYLPPLGKKTWQSGKDAIFDAYIYQLPSGRSVGYVRIASYEPDDSEKAAKEFAGLVQRFQGGTDALVIDQVDNPGGSVLYMYALAAMLTNRPLATPGHHVAITQQDVSEAVEFIQQAEAAGVKNTAQAQELLGKTQEGYTVDYDFFQHLLGYSKFIKSEWDMGKTLTAATYIEGVDQIAPSPTARYDKPILLLINELDFSGGDFFPAILQDNKRAVLFGTRTAGAGGFVRDVTQPNQVGVSQFSMTGSIAVRKTNKPIENLGVRADIQYAPTPADLQNGFQDYAKAVNAAVGGLIGSQAVSSAASR